MRDKWWIEKDRSGRDLIGALTRPEGVRKTTKTVMMVGIPAEIRTQNLPNTSLERHHYASPLGTRTP
jgi:hypothetical protein